MLPFLDLQFLFVYALACYGDATLLVHMAYTRHLIPSTLKSGATAYVFSLYETCAQVYDRISRLPATLNHRKVCSIFSSVMLLKFKHNILNKVRVKFSAQAICTMVYRECDLQMMLCEILDKQCCMVGVADESTNHIFRRSFPLTRWCTVADLIDMVVVDTGSHDVKSHQLYLFSDDKGINRN